MSHLLLARRAIRDATEKFRQRAGVPYPPFSPKGAETPPELRLERKFQHGLACGTNAVFVVLKALGVDCDLEEISRRVPLGDRGSSLSDLKTALEHYGVLCEVRKQVSPSDLRDSPMPCIVHLEAFGAGPHARDRLDHFAVLLRYNAETDWFCGVNTTNLVYTNYYPQTLARQMSGYVLFPTGGEAARLQRSARIALWIAVALVVLVVVANVVVLERSWRGRRVQ